MSAQQSGEGFVIVGLETDIRVVAEQSRSSEELRDSTRVELARLAYIEASAVASRANSGRKLVRLVDEQLRALGKPPESLVARTRYFEAAGDVAASASLATAEQARDIRAVMHDVAAMPLGAPIIFLPPTPTNPHTGLPRVASGGRLREVRATATGGATRIEFAYGRDSRDKKHNVRRITDMIPSKKTPDSEPSNPLGDVIVGAEAITAWVVKQWNETTDTTARSAVVSALRGTGVVLSDCMPADEARQFAADVTAEIKALNSRQTVSSSRTEALAMLAGSARLIWRSTKRK